MKRGAGTVLALLLSLPAFAEQPLALPPPDDPGFRLGVVTWGEASFAGQADQLTYGGRVSTDGPVANPWGRPLRLSVRLDITSTPGEAFDPADVTTFGRSAEARVGMTYRIASASYGGQAITTAVYAEGGFVTSMADQVLDRYLRQLGLGLEFAVAMGEQAARLRVGYARDERGGYIGAGQIALAGEVPLGGKGLVLGGDALLGTSRATVSRQADIFRVWVGLDVSRLWAVIAGS